MPKAIFFRLRYLPILLTLCAGCNKNSDSTCDEQPVVAGDSTTVVGTWVLSSSLDGLTGAVTHFPACNDNRIIFTDSSYTEYSYGELFRQGRYTIFPDSSRITHQVENRIMYDHDSLTRCFIRNTGSYLTIRIDATDGPAAGYSRSK